MGKRVGEGFAKKYGAELQRFYHEALLHGYGAVDGNITKFECDDGGTKIIYKRGVWQYSDKFFGGEPFGGMSVVRHMGTACFLMTYWGKVLPGVDKHEVYECLMPALLTTELDHPWRGPDIFNSKNGLRYENGWTGDIEEFNGYETICDPDNNLFYEASYYGGIVNKS